MTGAAYNRIGSGDLWQDGEYIDSRSLRAARLGQVSGNLYGHDPVTSPLDFVPERTWLDDAACSDMADLFERSANARTNAASTLRAKAVCASCPVQKACLDDAMEHETGPAAFRWGVRGGLSTGDRARLWAEQQAT